MSQQEENKQTQGQQRRARRPYTNRFLIRARTISHRITWFLGTRFSQTIPITFVVGYPKSGTVWATELVADYLRLPYPRYSLLPITFPAVVHGHTGIWDTFPQAMYIVRDPRDIIISGYFHRATRIIESYGGKNSRMFRKYYQHTDHIERICENLPHYIEVSTSTPPAGGLTWPEHVNTYLHRKNNRVGLLRYEELLNRGSQHLAQALEEMTGEPADAEQVQATIDRFTIKKQRVLRPGVRKGKPGDWTNYFSREAAQILDRYVGGAMKQMGYIDDGNWVQSYPPLKELLDRQPTEEVQQ